MKANRFFIFLFFLCGMSCCLKAQVLSQIVFESDTGSTASLWSVLAVPGAVPIELTPLINAQATYAGNNYGPINVSHNGMWYTFQSERFDSDCAGWHCLTVADSAFSNITSIRDGNGSVIHNEGISMITNGGKAIVYSSDAGTHTRDIFIVHKTGTTWTAPKMLSTISAYAYNINPRFSFDGSKVIFQAQSASYPGESIVIVDTNGTNYAEKINRTATVMGIVGCSEVNAPSFASDGSVFFEGLWGGERIWHFPNAAVDPVLPDPSDGNDNSPVGLPDGRVASLIMPNSTHDLKVENVDGTGKLFLTGTTTSFNHDISDVGLGAGFFNPFIVNIQNAPKTNVSFIIYPNPTRDKLTITLTNFNPTEKYQIELINALGKKTASCSLKGASTVINLPPVAAGIYSLHLYNTEKNVSVKQVVVY